MSETVENSDQSEPPAPDIVPAGQVDAIDAVAEDKVATEPASSAPFANPPLPPVSGKTGHPLIVLLLAFAGTIVVIIIGCNIFDVPLPYFLVNLDQVLDQTLRYKPANSPDTKDWRNDLLVEQSIWTGEVNKIKLGQTGAKPEMYKRDFLFYLADSYFRNDPHFMEAKAAYLAGSAEPRVAHTPGYDLSDAELGKKIGYCCLRLGEYSEAEKYFAQALKLYDQIQDPNLKIAARGNAASCLDFLTECAIRQNHLEEADKLIKERLERIHLPNIDNCIEHYLLFNNALLLEKRGRFAEAEIYFKRALEQEAIDDRGRGVVPGSANDNNRTLAYILREYSRFLRSQKRGAESFSLMDRACTILNNGP